MTQEDKQLLLKDLCARLPHEVIIQYKDFKPIKMYSINEFTFNGTYSLELAKPYLRPMSSMTEEEENEICQFMKDYNLLPGADRAGIFCGEIVDWLNAHHFDFRNLIGRGLAIEVTNENNPYKN